MIYTVIQYLRINRGLSANTAKAYDEALHDFVAFVADRYQGVTWRTVTKSMIDEYVVELVAEEKAPATIKQHISALRTYFHTVMALGGMGYGLTQNPARYVSTPKLGEQLPKTIEKEAIAAALADATVSAQAKAAIAIIYETGMRLQELLDLQAADIHPETHSITVRGKGNKQRTVYYGELTQKYGRCWHGKQHTQRGVRHMIYRALRPYSTAKQLSPHAIRHTFASTLLNNGMPLEAVSKLLGHQQTKTTEIYARLSDPTSRTLYRLYAPSL